MHAQIFKSENLLTVLLLILPVKILKSLLQSFDFLQLITTLFYHRSQSILVLPTLYKCTMALNQIINMRIASLFAAFLLAFAGQVSAQRNCASHDVLQQQILENPMLLEQMEEIEKHVQEHIHNHGAQERILVTIPVVFNIVYNTTAENISDAQILSQLNILNEDFRKLNADVANTPAIFASLAADCEINFCLATRDPNGNATTGIRRQSTTVTAFSSNDAVKFTAQGGLDAWPRDQYLNFWVCDLSGGLLGYAQFPGGAAATDGVVCDYQYVGNIGTATAPFNKGRTATHEVGHWLNLRHIWGDATCGSDLVSDTPTHNTSNGGCPAYPHLSTCTGTPIEMTMNYMDYTDDACMYMFSTGQKARMQALFATGGARVSLLSSLGCSAPGGGGTCAVPTGLASSSVTATSATVSWGAVSGAVSYNLQYKTAAATTWTTVSVTGTSANLTGLTASTTYNYQVQTVCSGSSSTYSTAASFTTTAGGGGGCTDAYETNETRATAKVIPVNTNITAKIGTATDNDHLRFSNTSTARRIKVDLTNLPADYDLKLYRGNTLLGTSENPDTQNEVLISNTTTVANNYIAYVYGYNGAFNNDICYTLRVSLSAINWRTDGTTDGDTETFELPVLFENAGFGMFPNPAKDMVTIEVPVQAESDVQVSIMDAAGRVAVQENRIMGKGNNQVQVELGRLVTGIYFVQVRNGENVHTRKLIVE